MIFVSILFVCLLYVRELREDSTVVLKHVGAIKDYTFVHVEGAFSWFNKRN